MKSLIPAAVIALLLHGLFLVLAPEWRSGRPKPLSRPRSVTMTLLHRAPAKSAVLPSDIPPAPHPAPAPARQLKKETKSPNPKPQSKMKKSDKKKVRPRTAPKKPLPASPSPRPAASPEKEASRETTAIAEKSFPMSNPAFSPKTTPRGQGSEGSHKEAPVPASPPLVRAIPRYRENPAPRYPRMAKRRGQEGTVFLEVLVNHEGKVKDLRIFHSSGYPVLDKAALSSVKKWVFEPGKRGDECMEMWVKIPVRFRLR